MHTAKIFLLMAIMLCSNDAYACRIPRTTFKEDISSIQKDIAIRDKDVVAKIKILKPPQNTSTIRGIPTSQFPVEVVVLEAIKGTTQGTVFMILTNICEYPQNLKSGDIYFIAGSFDKNGIFSGVW